jgi:hypothetical protein
MCYNKSNRASCLRFTTPLPLINCLLRLLSCDSAASPFLKLGFRRKKIQKSTRCRLLYHGQSRLWCQPSSSGPVWPLTQPLRQHHPPSARSKFIAMASTSADRDWSSLYPLNLPQSPSSMGASWLRYCANGGQHPPRRSGGICFAGNPGGISS